MLAFNNVIDATFIEIAMLPFLLIFTIFLAGRMATTSEINKRFLVLVASTLIAASCEVVIELFTDFHTITTYKKIFYAVMNINAYCLMAYVAAYTGSNSKTFLNVNFSMLFASVILLFVLKSDDDIYMLFSPGFAIIFVTEGFILQLLYQQYYGNGQFLVMNLLFMLLIDSFIIQYMFEQNIPLVYSVATMMLVFTFFYMEAPTYRQLITAHKEVEAARIHTEASIRKAEAANRAKSNFLASTSHEIRTPMNAILGINDMIINELGEKADKESRNAAHAIRRAGNYLLTLVNNILDISKIEAGKMELYETDYHLWEVLKECDSYVVHKINGNSKIRFVLEADDNMQEHLHGDVLRLKQAVINLLDNAVKYTKRGSVSLTVKSRALEGAIIISFTIEDTGLGMREEELKHIFEPFERANIIETRSILGAGLGLTLVRSILEIMSGTIDIKSKYGEGTKITLEFPQHIASGERFTMKEYEEFVTMNESAKEYEADKDPTPSEWPDAKILVVDDTPVNLVVAKGMLKPSLAKIETAESGEDALEMIKGDHFDIVFLDHKMPGMDGIETLRHAKKYTQDTKFIALTANAGANARNEYIANGFDDYLPKPFKSMEMMRILKTFLNKNK